MVEKYPKFVSGEKSEYFSEVKHFDSSNSHEEDLKEAKEYAKKIKGEVYTMIDSEGRYIDYEKGIHFVNRLGYAVLKK